MTGKVVPFVTQADRLFRELLLSVRSDPRRNFRGGFTAHEGTGAVMGKHNPETPSA
jgi:hypothetical protein